jgi:cell division protein FtsA
MQGVLGRSVRVGRPRSLTGMPDAHSGPGFSTLVGLAMIAASDRGDIRDIPIGPLNPKTPSGMLGKLVAALRSGF